MTQPVRVLHDYGTHSYAYRYHRDAQVYCPSCGQQTVWTEEGEGDYYAGPESVCTSCKSRFCLNLVYADPMAAKVAEQILAGGTDEPEKRATPPKWSVSHRLSPKILDVALGRNPMFDILMGRGEGDMIFKIDGGAPLASPITFEERES